MPKKVSTSTTSNPYSLRNKRHVDKLGTQTSSQSIKSKRAANRKQHKPTTSKPLDSFDDDFTIPEQVAKEWIARDNAPVSKSTILFIAEDWVSSSLGFFSHSPLLAEMEPRLSGDLDIPNNFSLSSNQI